VVRHTLLSCLTLTVVACGGWSAADTKSATNATKVELFVEKLCAGDGGTCSPSQVRALERAAYCANASMLYSHGQPVGDAGIRCAP
jgi:hypothetical protein